MIAFHKQTTVRALLVLTLIAFVIWRGLLLDVPFYWDEAWVYAPAVKSMTAHGISFLPSGLDPTFSRGHPVLFHALASSWATVFGTSAVALHAFALLIGALLILAIYRAGSVLGSEEVGLAAALMVLFNEAFLAQSGLLLPELMLAMWVVLATTFYVKRNSWGYLICAGCALLTKEAAIAPIIAFIVWQLIRSLFGGAEGREGALKWALIGTAPLLIGVGYFVIQYLTYGWVFFPEHIGMMTWDLKDLTYKSRLIFLELFEVQRRWMLLYGSTLVATLLWRNGRVVNRVVGALLFVAAIKALWGRWPLPFIPEPLSTLVILIPLFFVLFMPIYRKEGQRMEIIPLTFLVVIAFWGFTALNFYTERYLLLLFPLVAVAGMFYLEQVLRSYKKWLFPVVALLCIGTQASRIGADDGVGDTRLSYLDAIATDQAMIMYCEELQLHGSTFRTDFIQSRYMQDPGAGYLRSDRVFSNITSTPVGEEPFAIVTCNSRVERPADLRNEGYHLIHRVEIGKAWSELYARSSE